MKTLSQQESISPLGLILAIVLFSAIVPLTLLAAPAIASQIGMQLQLAPEQIGYLFTTELGAMSLATLPAYIWQTRFSWRRVAVIAWLVMIVANLACIPLSGIGYYPLLLGRFVAGFAGGSLMIVCLISAAQTANKDRVYGFWLLGQLILGTLGLAALPYLFTRFGIQAYYIFVAIFLIVCGFLIKFFPEAASVKNSNENTVEATTSIPKFYGFLAIAAVLLFYVCLGGVWTFVGEIAAKVSLLSAEKTGNVLAIASGVGIIGAMTASVIGKTRLRGIIIAGSFIALIMSVLLFSGVPDAIRFTVAALVFKSMWTFVLPFVLGVIADIDHSGRLLNTTNLVIGGGLSIGPAIAGNLIGQSHGYDSMLFLSAVLAGLSCLCILAVHRISKSNSAKLINQ